MAVVVSYNGLNDTENTLNALLGKVGHIHVVDNSSSKESIDILKSFSVHESISFTFLSKNMGIGYALNLGIEAARKNECSWLLTMDQDSLISDTIIESYCSTINQNPNIVCLSPTLSVFGKELIFNSSNSVGEPISVVRYAITSGNLVRLDIYSRVGGYDEALFIDCVDFDFSLKLRNSGYQIYHVKEAMLFHRLGEEHNIPDFLSKFYTSHSPLRRYYMFRNWGFMMKRYFSTYPFFILKSTCLHLFLLFIIPFYDRKPKESLKYIFYGLRDFCIGRKGQFIKD